MTPWTAVEKVYMPILPTLPSARAGKWRGIGRLVGRPSALAHVDELMLAPALSR